MANIRLRVRPSVLSSVARLFGALVLSLKIVRIGHHHHQLEREGAEEESGDGGCVLLLRASRIRERGAEGGGQGSKGWWCTYTIYYGLPKTPCWPEVPDVATKADQKNRGNDASPFPPLILVTIMNRISVLYSSFCRFGRSHFLRLTPEKKLCHLGLVINK